MVSEEGIFTMKGKTLSGLAQLEIFFMVYFKSEMT